tara:strand:+ start:1090 stop:1545 length:456 start_codon:yes stop_codon:yes gene_type:complete
MGTKISALTTTGSAPTGAYIPIAYDGENYKVNPLGAITGLRYVEPWATTIGGVAIVNGATFTITHNLGTTAVLIQGYVNRSLASDTDAQSLEALSPSSTLYGFSVTSKSVNTITIQLGLGYYDWSSAGVGSAVSFGYHAYGYPHLKFIIFA